MHFTAYFELDNGVWCIRQSLDFQAAPKLLDLLEAQASERNKLPSSYQTLFISGEKTKLFFNLELHVYHRVITVKLCYTPFNFCKVLSIHVGFRAGQTAALRTKASEDDSSRCQDPRRSRLKDTS